MRMANLCQSTAQHADICDDQIADKCVDQSADMCDEMWVEILSRLPIKSLLVCQSVCSNWRNIVVELKKKIWSDPQLVPVCGLLHLLPPTMVLRPIISYTCIKTGKKFFVPYNSADERYIARSGYERGLLADLDLEFSSFINCIRTQRYFMTMHQGLILITHVYGFCQVYNPVTKEWYDVPNEWIMPYSDIMMRVGMIITFPTLPGCKCEFMIVRLSPVWRSINIYCSETRCWERCTLKLGENHQLSNEIDYVSDSCLMKYVALVDGSDSSLFFRKGKHVVAIKLSGRKQSKIADEYVIPQPQNMKVEDALSRVWGCGGNLYFTCFTQIELEIWKHPKEYDWRAADACAWVPLVKISMSICQQVKAAVGGSLDAPRPIACNPETDVMYLVLRGSVFAYDLRSDMLYKISERNSVFGEYLPFKPCLSSLYAFN